ncbi:SDR family NAD(P)-dependent oxidoreductase [Salinibacterium sp. GXW1014]|uniref:SDR family NAD(P)-dependent oxidoreductase n=1 Tax=Salinibacterium sp. GXW1014 TaxID=3377838 RepID=UPI003839DBEF
MRNTTADGSLNGKVALVTGAGRGLGLAITRALLDAGADVVVAGRNGAALDAVVKEASSRAQRAFAQVVDVASEESVDALVSAALAEFGRIDILVNNAGVLSTVPFLEQDAGDWDRIISTNLGGTFLVTRAVGRHMVEQGGGKVINMASNFALNGVPHHAAYSASKAGVIALTKSLAVEWARYGIQVNALAPGYFTSDINAELRADDETLAKVLKTVPSRRMGDPDIELAPWVLALAGPQSGYMTGEVIVLDGGMTAQ